MTDNLQDKSHNNFFQRQGEQISGKMKLKLHTQDKHIQKIQDQVNIIMKKKKMT